MATLRLFWHTREVFDLWSWSGRPTHGVAQIIKQVRENLCTAVMGPHGEEPEQIVLMKIARGTEGLQKLKREANFYENDLLHLQGSVVPKFYGLYRTKIKGVDFGCMLLEYCTGSLLMQPREFNRCAMIAICQLHAAGVYHNNIVDGIRHVVLKGQGVRIVDFSTATRHKCRNGVPTLYNGHPEGKFCRELIDMEKTFGINCDAASIPLAIVAVQACWNYQDTHYD